MIRTVLVGSVGEGTGKKQKNAWYPRVGKRNQAWCVEAGRFPVVRPELQNC